VWGRGWRECRDGTVFASIRWEDVSPNGKQTEKMEPAGGPRQPELSQRQTSIHSRTVAWVFEKLGLSRRKSATYLKGQGHDIRMG
jgi:hypothetical protein